MLAKVYRTGAGAARHTGFGVALETQHNLRGTVPSCGNVFRHVACILFGVDRETSCQTKIANLEFAVRVDQQISGLQVTVQDIRRVDVLETAQNLVDKRLEVGVGKRLARTNDCGEIALHQLYIETAC